MKSGGLDQYKRLIRFAFNILLLGCLMFFFIRIWDRNYNDWIVFPFYYKGFLLMGAFYALFFVVFSYILGGMKIGYLKSSSLMLSQTLALIAANVSIYLETVLLSARFVNIIPMIELTAIDIVVIFIWTFLVNRIFRKLFPARHILLLYEEYDPSMLLRKVNSRKDRYLIKKSMNVEEGWESITKEMCNYDAVFLCDIHSPLRNRLVKYCYANGIRSYITPKISDIIIRSSENIHMFDTPLLLSRNNGLSFEQKLVKRFMDIVISLVMLVITSPFMLVTAVAIKLYDGGPVFFRQKRCTINGREFYIHKFRSMIVNAEKEGEVIPATDDDERITPVGKVIRKTRLDELPQFIDILKGDMSVVGPRPERVEHVEMYTRDIPEFSYRLKVKGGLTGYAQIYGKYNTTAYDKLKLDLMYIQNYSLLLDLKLIIMTVKIIFVKESTEGFEDAEK
ncbi:MAG TPA: sugar transferase [Candidatus Mediterraneibacter surreyensis]|nr:sugar transferase [Candidatus Mediterraneibacter surreyensis]